MVFGASLRISWRVQYDGYVVGKFENEEAQRGLGSLQQKPITTYHENQDSAPGSVLFVTFSIVKHVQR